MLVLSGEETQQSRSLNVLRQNAAHYRTVDILEAVTCFTVCLCSILYLGLHFCSYHVIFSKNKVPSLLQ